MIVLFICAFSSLLASTTDQHLKDLEWIIGAWIDEDPDVEINSIYRWNETKNFIVGDFSLSSAGKLELQGTQIIAWDHFKQKIRSWMFDSDGTFGEATWYKKGKSWVVENSQTLNDGSQASAINIYTPIDSNRYTWESEGREVGGILLPNIDPIIVKKKPR